MPINYDPMNYLTRPGDSIKGTAGILANMFKELPGAIEKDEQIKTLRANAKSDNDFNTQAYTGLKSIIQQELGADPSTVRAPKAGESPSDYLKYAATTFASTAQGKGMLNSETISKLQAKLSGTGMGNQSQVQDEMAKQQFYQQNRMGQMAAQDQADTSSVLQQDMAAPQRPANFDPMTATAPVLSQMDAMQPQRQFQDIPKPQTDYSNLVQSGAMSTGQAYTAMDQRSRDEQKAQIERMNTITDKERDRDYETAKLNIASMRKQNDEAKKRLGVAAWLDSDGITEAHVFSHKPEDKNYYDNKIPNPRYKDLLAEQEAFKNRIRLIISGQTQKIPGWNDLRVLEADLANVNNKIENFISFGADDPNTLASYQGGRDRITKRIAELSGGRPPASTGTALPPAPGSVKVGKYTVKVK